MKKLTFFSCIAALGLLAACGDKKNNPIPTPPTDFSLTYMEMQERVSNAGSILYLHGNFGDSSATSKVKIGNTVYEGSEVEIPMPQGKILSWTRTLIKLGINVDANHDGGHGNVSVLSGDKETNKRILNVWHGTLTYYYPSGGSLEEQVDMDVYLRADNKPPSQTVLLINPESSFSSISKATYKVGGQGTSTYVDGCTNTMIIHWDNASGIIPLYEPYTTRTNETENFQVKLKFTDLGFHITSLKVHKFKASKSTQSGSTCGNAYTNAPQDFHLTNMVSDLQRPVLTFSNNTSTIKSGSLEITQQPNHAGLIYNAGQVPDLHAKITWNDIVAKYL